MFFPAFEKNMLLLRHFRPFFTPNLKSQPILLDIKRNVRWSHTYFVQKVFRNSLSLSVYLKRSFRDWPWNKKRKLDIFENMILSNFCFLLYFNTFQKVFLSRDIEGQRVAVLVHKIPNYVTNDVNNIMMWLRTISWKILLL